MEVKFEYLGEDRDFPDAKTYKVEAIHVTTTRNNRKFTQKELASAGRSLSFRPLNINHDEGRGLPFPENATLGMEFDAAKMAVVGKFRVLDPAINAMIETNRINQVSIEQIPTKGETCNEVLCEQHGVAFIGMALLESDVIPGDKNANIKKESAILSLSEILISDAQRTCNECSDHIPCHSCQHKGEADQHVQACLDEIQRTHPEMPQDVRVVHCLEELNRVNEPAAQSLTIQINNAVETMKNKMKSEKLTIAQVIGEYKFNLEYASYYHKVLTEKWVAQQ